VTRILLVVALAACGGGTRQPAPAHPEPPPATKPIETQGTPAAVPLAADECQLLVRHVVQVALKERPEDQQVSTDEQAKLDWRTAIEACQSMRRDSYECAMAATATTQMAACDHLTPSNSTSNSSVAPGGMTPPAPR
jgi:hypothetical protein